jgi:CRISPR-associated exonuclease Cas4
MAYDEDDFLLISGIQHFAFCRRQWALIHIEQCWADNERTIGGELMHESAHDPFFTEKRGDLIITRDMPVFSRLMGVTGHCDIVELRRDDTLGVMLAGREGRWLPCPVEYKYGRPMKSDADHLQLCSQAMCLEEMLACPAISVAYMYYHETNRREAVTLDEKIREKVRSSFAEMHMHLKRGYTPRVKPQKACGACSLNEICLPTLPASEKSVSNYINRHLNEESF